MTNPRFNPPPNWPRPPHDNWTPPPGWQPDPAWGPPPSGWQLYEVDSSEVTPSAAMDKATPSRARKAIGCGCLSLVGLVAIGSCSALVNGTSTTAATAPPQTVTATVTATATATATETVIRTATATVTATATATITASPTSLPQVTRTVSVPGPTVTVTKVAAVPGAASADGGSAPSDEPSALGLLDSHGPYYANCTDARDAGAAPMQVGDPGYRLPLDRDRDGIACE